MCRLEPDCPGRMPNPWLHQKPEQEMLLFPSGVSEQTAWRSTPAKLKTATKPRSPSTHSCGGCSGHSLPCAQGWQRMLSSTGTEILFFLSWASSLRRWAQSDEPGGLWQRTMFITSGAMLLFQVKISQHKEFLWYLTFKVQFGSWAHFCLISKTGF